jgi:hypothetical protein
MTSEPDPRAQGATSGRRSDPDLWREIRRTYGFPLTMFALAIIPGLNFTYSGHGGPSWFFIPLCCPYILVRGSTKLTKAAPAETLAWYRRFFAITIPAYIALAFPLSWAATASLQHTFGLTVPVWSFMFIMISPFPYWYFS